MEMEKQEKRERILNATERLMAKLPDKEISVTSIAKEAGMGKGSIYYYFESKEEILYAVVERAYKTSIYAYLDENVLGLCAIEKIRHLFGSLIRSEFKDKQTNVFRTLHVNENPLLHNYMKQIAIQEISPILEKILLQGIGEKTIYTETPKESAEMIVATLTFLFDGTVFQDNEGTYRKLKVFANVLETCLGAEKGSFDFLFDLSLLLP